MTTTGSEIVVLREGLSVTKDALEVLWKLEDRGHDVRLDDDGDLFISNTGLTDTLRASIRRLKPEIVALMRYTPNDAHLYRRTLKGEAQQPCQHTT